MIHYKFSVLVILVCGFSFSFAQKPSCNCKLENPTQLNCYVKSCELPLCNDEITLYFNSSSEIEFFRTNSYGFPSDIQIKESYLQSHKFSDMTKVYFGLAGENYTQCLVEGLITVLEKEEFQGMSSMFYDFEANKIILKPISSISNIELVNSSGQIVASKTDFIETNEGFYFDTNKLVSGVYVLKANNITSKIYIK